MSDIAIKVRGLGKKYYIGERMPQRTLADSLKTAVKYPYHLAKGILTGKGMETREEFWALNDVSFDVKQGEVLGIIGRNGAGKSTLLKILSRIVAPTRGEVEMTGRVGSLLEVGTGFHPELTGRENIYFNGSLLGMTKAEVTRKFDEIVDFSGVEKFIDTPVKFYSSGMYTRLAFAVAAHLEPEILIVDEVLAVGDAEFQKKCLGKMDSIAKSGRTVLFVSHNMSAVQSLCSNCILLDKGNILTQSTSLEAIERYMQAQIGCSTHIIVEPDPKVPLQILKAEINSKGERKTIYDVFDPVELILEYEVREPQRGMIIALELCHNGNVLYMSFDSDQNEDDDPNIKEPGLYIASVYLNGAILKPGVYTLTLSAGIVSTCSLQRIEDALTFEIQLLSRNSNNLSYTPNRPGIIASNLNWNVSKR